MREIIYFSFVPILIIVPLSGCYAAKRILRNLKHLDILILDLGIPYHLIKDHWWYMWSLTGDV